MSDHGRSKYCNEGCRCVVCRGAQAEWQFKRTRQRYAWVAENGLPASVSHSYSAYTNWGCRCTVCTKAARDQRRKAS